MEEFEPITYENKVVVSDISQPELQHSAPKEKKQAPPGKKEKKRLRHSRWFVTVNTNKSFPDCDNPNLIVVIAKLKEALQKFIDPSKFGEFIFFTNEEHR